MSTKLRACSDVQVTKVTYEWEIKKISHRMPYLGTILSPMFHSSDGKAHRWQLVLNLQSPQNNPDYISVDLKLCASTVQQVRGKYQFFFITKSLTVNKPFLFDVWKQDETHGLCSFVKRSELLENKDIYLPDDTFTVGCYIETYGNVSHNSVDDVVVTSLQTTINNHQFGNALESLIGGKNIWNSDVTIVCDSKSFKAHKLILAVRSSVFSAMFANEEMIENQTNEIKIKDMTPEVVSEMLHYIYTDKIENERLVLELLNASEKYQLSGLKAKCELIFMQKLHYTNAAQVFVWADLYNAEQLKQRTLDFICEHETEIWTTEGFNKLVESHPLLLAEVYKTRVSKKLNK